MANVTKERTSTEYTAKSIQVLEGLEPVRKRPGMYIGGTSLEGLHHLIWEVVANSIDESMAGYGKLIDVVIGKDNTITVTDEGRGIPVDKHKQTGLTALETIFTKLHAGGKFGGEDTGYKVSGGLHGVGASVVNALSVLTRAEIHKGGKIWIQEYSRGITKGKVQAVGKTDKTGSIISFKPDPEIFPEIEWNWKTIVNYMRQQAYLTKGVHFKLTDERFEDPKQNRSIAFCFDGGIRSFVQFANRKKDVVHPTIFYVEKERDNMVVEVAVQYQDTFKDKVSSFANNIPTIEGGTHETGFRASLTRVINEYARKNNILKEKENNLTSDDVREGLTAVVSVKLQDPQFEGQTKSKLGNSEARTITSAVVSEGLTEYFEENPQDAKMIIMKGLISAKARLAAKAAKDAVVRKGVLEGMTLPGKLADCSSRDASKTELYIVEGDSAGGSAKQGRDRRTQAILPLKGKILNVEKARLDRMLASQEIKSLVIALGAGIGDQMNFDKLRYHRIIIMTDADVDGSHIRTLLLTLFYRHFEELLKRGYVYIAQPPLFQIKDGKKEHYVYTDEEKEKVLAQIAKRRGEVIDLEIKEGDEEEIAKLSGVSLQRYKGLGEMNPTQLWETTMNPETRVMLQVTIEDAERADEAFSVLMGSEVAPRKKFIQSHANKVRNLDV